MRFVILPHGVLNYFSEFLLENVINFTLTSAIFFRDDSIC
jgi:hypothetical protein